MNCENDDEEEIVEENGLLPWCSWYVLGFIPIFSMPLFKENLRFRLPFGFG